MVAITVNDPVVVKAFQDSVKVDPTKITMVAGMYGCLGINLSPLIDDFSILLLLCCEVDWDAAFTKSVGQEVDLSAKGLGLRSKRYVMFVNNGKVRICYCIFFFLHLVVG